MTERWSNDGEGHLLEHLRAALSAADPAPASVRAAAVAAFSLRTLDAELAELAYDSAVDERVPAGVRGSGGPRLVTFSAAALTVEVEVAERGRTRRVVGQLVPPAAGAVELRHRDGTLRTHADALGRFAIAGVTPGPVRIRCEVEQAEHPVETDWIML